MIGGCSFFLANVLYLTVEYPFVKLSKLLMLNNHNKRGHRNNNREGDADVETDMIDRSSSLYDVTTTAADRLEMDNVRGKTAHFDDGTRIRAEGGDHTVAVLSIDTHTSS